MTVYSQPAAVCADGLTSKGFEERSAALSGKTVAEWRKAVAEALSQAKTGDPTARVKRSGDNIPLDKTQADRLSALGKAMTPDAKTGQAAVPYGSSDDLDSLLDGKVKGFEDFHGYDARERPMWAYLKQKNLAYEKDWQHITSISFVEKKPDGVDDKGNPKTKKIIHYVEADKIPYVVRRGSFQPAWGSYVKVTAPNGNSTFARVLEGGPTDDGTEASLKTWQNLGYGDVNPDAAPKGGGTLTYETIGNPPATAYSSSYADGYLSNEEIQLSGSLIQAGKANNIATHQDLYDTMNKVYGAQARTEAGKKGVTFPEDMKTSAQKAAEKKAADEAAAAAKAKDPKSKGGGKKLKKGFKTVAIGPTMRLAGYADAACVHEGGGSVKEGSCSVYVGAYPMARIGDGTTDDLGIVSGNETVLIGGAPTSQKLDIA